MSIERYRITSSIRAGILEVNENGVVVKAEPFSFQHLVGRLLFNVHDWAAKSGGRVEKIEEKVKYSK